ncbi:HK97 family phage prohead protease [Azospirillum agricola]|uniref:HK97 family phage prohead protease n=1 Tax=Azospirillum agricola TaxID=1720247 RepID=UPI000A0F3694|nr:HK97 family phage prohead protease [Azospirillum agricola]SMH60486.1 prohead peptidase. Unknown type peptidase. MEROPS family U35 [Azospirillum lipoferum]
MLRRRDLETRFQADPAGSFEGYASVYGVKDSYGDTVAPGAFAASLAAHRNGQRRVLMLWAHNPAEPIGVWEGLEEDARGLKVRGRLILSTRRGQEARDLMRAGALDGLSIGFRTRRAVRASGGGRVLQDVELVEVSLVALPSNRDARVLSVKSAAGAAPGAAGLAAFIRACAAQLGGQ